MRTKWGSQMSFGKVLLGIEDASVGCGQDIDFVLNKFGSIELARGV